VIYALWANMALVFEIMWTFCRISKLMSVSNYWYNIFYRY